MKDFIKKTVKVLNLLKNEGLKEESNDDGKGGEAYR